MESFQNIDDYNEKIKTNTYSGYSNNQPFNSTFQYGKRRINTNTKIKV
jgi:hypothetical protein